MTGILTDMKSYLVVVYYHECSKSWSYYFLSLLKNCNHKGLGIYYLLSAFIFGISGTLISVLIRIELYSSGNRIISPENQNFYNISITLHGFLMIFFLVMPGLFGGFGNYFVVIFQGSCCYLSKIGK
jgi:cytochrome c oxidase subunit 1